MHDGKIIFPNPSMFIDFSIQNGPGGFKSIDLANAVILVFVFWGTHPFVFSKIAGTPDCSIVH